MALFKKTDACYWELQPRGLTLAWVNSVGGYHDYRPEHLSQHTIVEAPSFGSLSALHRALDLKDDVLLDDIQFGWLSPEGEFYGCHYCKHLDLIEYGLDLQEGEAEQKGWIKVTSKLWYLTGLRNREPTSSQKRTLKKIGRDPNCPDWVDESLTYEKAFPRGNPAMKKLAAQIDQTIAEEEAKLKKVTVTPSQVRQFI